MKKRISDKELKEIVSDPYNNFVKFTTQKLENLALDLQDAREVIKTIETYGSMLEKKKPSLAEHLQKLANKHKVCFTKRDGALITFFDDSTASMSATVFFGFDINDYNEDFYAPNIINPEVTDE